MIKDWYNDTFDVYRQVEITDDSGNVVGTQEQKQGSITGDLQQLDAEKAETMNLSFRKGFVLRVDPDADVEEGDTLKRSGNEYGVNGIHTYDHEKLNNVHKEVILEG